MEIAPTQTDAAHTTTKAKGHKYDGRSSVSFEISPDVEAQESKADGLTRAEKKAWSRFLQQNSKHNETLMILQSVSVGGRSGSTGGNTSRSIGKGVAHRLPLWMRFDKQAMLRKDFLNEMRLLSRLRHPCITTVMGAVIAPRTDPMLVMEFMDYGSLYDLIRNETMYLSGEILLQIIRDVVSGIQFLHSSSTPIMQ
jgi:serine/threonine protein kinase